MPRRGRPYALEEGKRAHVGFRAPTQLKHQLKDAAESKGRSLSQEIEFRVEASFRDDWIVEQIRRVVKGEG